LTSISCGTATVPSWRPLTWVVLGVQVLFVIWLILGINAASDSNCSNSEYADACRAGEAIGTGIGIGLIILLWALVDVILGVVWMVTNKGKRTCPVCGRNVKKGLLVCTGCGFDFAAAARGQGYGAGFPQGPYPPPSSPRSLG
jgi:hypothetical protein